MLLRPYQLDVLDECRRTVAAGQRRLIIVAPTGSGKTVIAASLIHDAAKAGNSVVVLAHRREIIAQTVSKLHDQGIECGVVQDGFGSRSYEPVQVASVQTLWSRAMRRRSMPLPPADMFIIDECHHAPAETYSKIVGKYPDAVLVGLTATPCRGDGRGLGGIFDAIVYCPQVADLIVQGHLVKTKTYAPVDPNLKGVKVEKGDYVIGQLAERMDTDALVGDICTHWHKYGERRKTVVFAVNVQHSLHIRDEFIKSEVRAEHIDGSTPKRERDAVLARLACGQTELVTNCMVLTEGWDLPAIGCCILARPTRKMGLYRQMIGRVLRPADGKPDAIVLDHSGAVFRHGFVEDRIEWTLDPDKGAAKNRVHAKRVADGYRSRMIECTECGAVRITGNPCNACGFMPAPPPKAVDFADGELGLVKDGRAQPTPSDPEKWLSMLTWIARERGYKPAWVGFKFQKKFGSWPTTSPEPRRPSPEVLSWVRAQNIAYAKAKSRGAA